MQSIFLKAGKERSLKRRHPWVYSQAIDKTPKNLYSGETIIVRDSKGEFLAYAAYSPQSSIRARVWSFHEQDQIDQEWFTQRISAAVQLRAHLRQRASGIRLVYGEADGLPGLIVDQYADVLVAQCLAAGVEANKALLMNALQAATGCKLIYERSDAATREREGLPLHHGPAVGEPPALVQMQEDGVQYEVDIIKGHKTGFYLDQRESRYAIAHWVRMLTHALGHAPTVLNCFSYTGGFSLAAAKAGAAHTISIDSSQEALNTAARNSQLNGIDPARFETLRSDVSDALKRYEREGTRFDLIVLDPPKFAPSVQHIDRAARAYKDLNLRALRILNPGGVLATFSCSGAISVELFQKIVAGAVVDAHVDAHMIGRLGPGEDHPMAMTHPEGEYLKGLLLRRV